MSQELMTSLMEGLDLKPNLVSDSKASCQFGRAGDRCPDRHPGLCRSFIARGEAGCGLGADCPKTVQIVFEDADLQ